MKRKITFVFTLVSLGLIGLKTVFSYRGKVKELERSQELVYKNDKIIRIFDEFLTLKQEQKNLGQYFKDNGYKRIAIYGLSYLGRRLYDELKSADVEVVYFIDKSAENIEGEIPVLKPDRPLPSADIIIVTPIFYFRSIETDLENYVNCPIISLEDVLDEVLLLEY